MNIWLFIKNYYKWSLQEITIWCGGLFSNEQYKRNKSNSTRSKYGPFRNFSDIYFLNICAHVLFVASNFSHNVYRRLIVERERKRDCSQYKLAPCLSVSFSSEGDERENSTPRRVLVENLKNFRNLVRKAELVRHRVCWERFERGQLFLTRVPE